MRLIPEPPGCPHLLSLARRAENLGDGSGERGRIARIDKASGDTVDDLIGDPCDPTGDDGTSDRHSLEDDDWKVLVTDGWKDHDTSHGIQRPRVGVLSEESHPLGYPKRLRQMFERRAFRTITRQHQHDVIELRRQLRERLQDITVTFSRFEARDHKRNANLRADPQ